MKKILISSIALSASLMLFSCASSAPVKKASSTKASKKSEAKAPVVNGVSGANVTTDSELDSSSSKSSAANADVNANENSVVKPFTQTGSKSTHGWINDIRAKLDKNPNDARVWVEYGNYLYSENKITLAEKMYDKALGLSPKNVEALNNKAAILFKKGEPELAVALLNQAYETDEFTLTPKKNLARLCLEHSLWRKAINLLGQITVDKKATEADILDARIGLATAYLAINDLENAGREFEFLSGEANPDFNLVYNFTKYLNKAQDSVAAKAYLNRNIMKFSGDEREKLNSLQSEISKGSAK